LTKHFVLPDCQIRPGDNTDFLERIGRFIVEKQPEVIINLGDFADMSSLSSYDVGRKSFEGRRYVNDIEAARNAMSRLLNPIDNYNAQQRRNGKKQYKPRKILTYGNHCDRITRAINSDPKLDGTLDLSDLGYESFGWETFPFLEVAVVDSVAYSHFFVTGTSGRPCSSARVQLNKKMMSCISGHQQVLDIAMQMRADGKRLTSVIAGACYEHQEDYLGPQGNRHWRGCLMLHDVNDGEFNLVPVPLTYLEHKYGSN
jgi:hypothetical protein